VQKRIDGLLVTMRMMAGGILIAGWSACWGLGLETTAVRLSIKIANVGLHKDDLDGLDRVLDELFLELELP
jgi:hypothetical protein